MRDTTIAVFFIFYMLIGYLIVMNLILAVLIDEFLKAADEKRAESAAKSQLGAARSFLFGPLDPILEQVIPLSHLQQCQQHIFQSMQFPLRCIYSTN